MVTILSALQGINSYPVPLRTLTEIAQRRGVSLDADADSDALNGAAYNLCRADVLMWLSIAPNVTQGGQSYSFTDEQRTDLRNKAQQLYQDFEVEDNVPKTIYGYKGSRL